MYLKLNAKVYCDPEGKHIGKLRFVDLNPGSRALNSIGVQRGLDPHHIVLIASEDISEVTPDGTRINLKVSSRQVEELPFFIEAHTVTLSTDGFSYRVNEPGLTPPSSLTIIPGMTDVVYSPLEDRPGLTTEILFPSDSPEYKQDASFVAQLEVENQQEKLVFQDALRFKEDMEVVDKDDKLIGHLCSLYFNSRGKLNRFTVKGGFLLSVETILLARFIDQVYDNSISLRYTKEHIRDLLYTSRPTRRMNQE